MDTFLRIFCSSWLNILHIFLLNNMYITKKYHDRKKKDTRKIRPSLGELTKKPTAPHDCVQGKAFRLHQDCIGTREESPALGGHRCCFVIPTCCHPHQLASPRRIKHFLPAHECILLLPTPKKPVKL